MFFQDSHLHTQHTPRAPRKPRARPLVSGAILTVIISAACYFIIIVNLNQPAYVLVLVYALIALNIAYIYRTPLLLRIGDAHLLSGSFDKAGSFYKRARNLDKKSAAACNSYGIWLVNANNPDEAAVTLEAGLSLNPGHDLEKNMTIALIGACLAKNDAEGACKHHEQIKASLDDDINIRLSKLIAEEQKKEAVT